MSPDLVNRAALAFLDQFIGRGAAPDVRDVRRKLRTDADAQQLLVDQLPRGEVDERGAFDAFRRFLAIELEERGTQEFEGPPDLGLLLAWTTFDDHTTSDPAQWPDWLAAVSAARQQADPQI